MQYTRYAFGTCKLYNLVTNCKLMYGICVYFYVKYHAIKKCNDYLISKFNGSSYLGLLVADECLQMNHSKIAFC